jgi:hypothetical protein
MEEVTGGRRKLHDEELHTLNSSPIRYMRNAYKVLIGKLEKK